jgi:hypothetical protein
VEGVGKRNTVAKQKDAVPGDSFVRNVGSEHADMTVECFSGIRAEQLHRMIGKR